MQGYQKKLPYILCLLVAFVAGVKQIREPDIWWQLLAGRWMVENGAITHTDTFSFTMAGKPWINVKWLYEILIAVIEKGLGAEGVMLLQALISAAIVYLLIRVLRMMAERSGNPFSTFYTALTVVLFLLIVEYRMAGRPEMISHLLCAVYLFILFLFPSAAWKQMLWLLPLQCLWANMHEGYPVGMVMIGTFAAGQALAWVLTKNRKYLAQAGRMGIIFAGAAVAILLNPNTIQLWKQPFEIYRQVWANKYTTELLSISDSAYWTIQAKIFIPLLVLVTLYWLVRIVKERKNKDTVLFQPFLLAYLLLIPLFGYLALTANRNIPFAQIVLFPSVPLMLQWLIGLVKASRWKFYGELQKRALILSVGLLAFFYIAIVSDKYYKWTGSPNRFGMHVNMMHNPVGAAEFIDQHNLKGLVFSDYFISSYLLWKLYPEFRSYIDLRDLDVFPASFFDQYFELYNDPGKFGKLITKYNFNYIVISTSQLQGLVQQLYWRDGYNMVYADPVSVIFLKDTEENKALNHDRTIQKMFSWPLAPEAPAWTVMLNNILRPGITYDDEDEMNMPLRSALFYNSVGNYKIAVKELQPFIGQYEDNAQAYVTLATSYMQYAAMMSTTEEGRSRLDSAVYFLETAKEIDPKEKSVYSVSGNLHLITGNHAQARVEFEEYIKLDKTNDQVYFMLGISDRYIWQNGGTAKDRDKMIDAMDRAVELNDKFLKPCLYAAEGYQAKGDRDKARANLQKAKKWNGPWDDEEKKLLERLEKELL